MKIDENLAFSAMKCAVLDVWIRWIAAFLDLAFDGFRKSSYFSSGEGACFLSGKCFSTT